MKKLCTSRSIFTAKYSTVHCYIVKWACTVSGSPFMGLMDFPSRRPPALTFSKMKVGGWTVFQQEVSPKKRGCFIKPSSYDNRRMFYVLEDQKCTEILYDVFYFIKIRRCVCVIIWYYINYFRFDDFSWYNFELLSAPHNFHFVDCTLDVDCDGDEACVGEGNDAHCQGTATELFFFAMSACVRVCSSQVFARASSTRIEPKNGFYHAVENTIPRNNKINVVWYVRNLWSSSISTLFCIPPKQTTKCRIVQNR